MALLLDVRDLSTEDVLHRARAEGSTPTSRRSSRTCTSTRACRSNFSYNLTCLVPTENPEVGAPARLGLKEILWHFLHFRLEVVTRRLENELAALEKRIHILEGFALVFDALDEIIRSSASQSTARRTRRRRS